MKRELTETQHTINEAEYFLKKIQELERYGDDDEFEYNFHAFLHSWASIFDIILEDYQRSFGLRISAGIKNPSDVGIVKSSGYR